jgi:dephospho-CoA kinase
MKILGLTGGIGSGKSVVSKLFQISGIPVYDSDIRSKILCDTDIELKESLIQLFGFDIYTDNLLNRQNLAKHIFNDKGALKTVNALIHPAVERDFREWVDGLKSDTIPAVAQETAILFEAGLEKQYDQIICVIAPEGLRIARVCKRSGLDPEAVSERIKNQLSQDELIRQSDVIIENDGIHALIPQVNAFIRTISETKDKIHNFF